MRRYAAKAISKIRKKINVDFVMVLPHVEFIKNGYFS